MGQGRGLSQGLPQHPVTAVTPQPQEEPCREVAYPVGQKDPALPEELLAAHKPLCLLHGLMSSRLQETPGCRDVPPYLAACPQSPPAPAWAAGISGGVIPEVGVDRPFQPVCCFPPRQGQPSLTAAA